MSDFLRLLADVLRSQGFGGVFVDRFDRPLVQWNGQIDLYDGEPSTEAWEGGGEHAELFHLMLEILDSHRIETRYETAVVRHVSKTREWMRPGVRAHWFKGRKEEPGWSYRWTGQEVEAVAPSRTKACAEYLIAADHAGLLSAPASQPTQESQSQ